MNASGISSQIFSIGEYFFNKSISKYFFFLCWSFIFTPFQGNFPENKYINICPIDSRSSLLLCSTPLEALYDAYLTVPNILPVKENLTCFRVRELRYFLAMPKSIKYIVDTSSYPVVKFSGFISRWMIFFE